MKWFRFFLPAVAVFPPPAAPVSAQAEIALLGGVTRSWWVQEHDVVIFGTSSAQRAQPSEQVVRGSAGVTATIPLREWFAVQFGTAFFQKGGLDYSPWGGNSRREIDYLEVKLLGRLGVPLADLPSGPLADLPFHPHLLWGFFVASPVSCRVGTRTVPGERNAVSWSDCATPVRAHGDDSPGDGGLDGGVLVGGGMDVRLTELDERLGATVSLLYGHSLGSGHWGRMRTVTLRGGLVYHTR